ncbi:MAG TPA: type II toxin-antitoxin system RelE/ParE family toxin [Micropepsaceae bacterium]|jgi:phage-related protein|nr:type II toxin-antitoxin system RelE/ParE family toxin [Micropepsaceae bacterium]
MRAKGRGSSSAAGQTEGRLGRALVWIGSSKDDISGMPSPVKASFGYRLRRIQRGLPVADAKALSQFGPGVLELREAYDTNAYRVMYVVSLKHAVYVLHAFIKKSKSGIALPKSDANVIRRRLQRAQAEDAENGHA